MTDIMVSVIIPTYNRPELVARSIRSVLSQSFLNIEILVIDDNPPDSDSRKETEKTVSLFLSDPRVKYLPNERNMGVSLSRNRGIDNAEGEYITFLDDDDAYLSNKIEEQIRLMTENNLDLCLCDGAIYDDQDRILKTKKRNLPLNLSLNELMRYHMMFHLTGTNTMMFRTSFLRSIGGFDDVQAAEEYYLTEKAILSGARIGNIDTPLTKTYQHRGEHITTSTKKISTEMALFERKKQYFDLLSKKERRVVVCRHYATLAFANMKCRRYFRCFEACALGIFTSTNVFLRIAMENRKKL